MATLISAQNLAKTFGTHALFTDVAVQLNDGDRLGLIGPNGAGKSTLLRIMAGLETTDEGEAKPRKGATIVYVAQDDVFAADATVMSAVVEAVTRHTAAAQDPDHHEHHHHHIEAETQAAITLSKLGFVDFDQAVNTLSGGWKKRLSIACALAQDPDVLMLDEPTNHLDLEGIIWLEQFVQQTRLAVVFVTHDRQFLENVAERIIELSAAYPGGTFGVKGNYSEFVRRKFDFLEAQAATQSALANRVRQDTAWLQQGIQGRQTRNKTQVADATRRRSDLKNVKERNAAPERTTTIEFQATSRQTKKLMVVQHLRKSLGERDLFDGLDLSLSPGTRVGLLGPNGSGKTTLLRILNEDLKANGGTIERAEDLQIVVFSQHREDLNPQHTLQEALCPVGDRVEYRGNSVHVTSWAKRFLFEPGQLITPVSQLSGGEKARVLVAQLMLKPADVLLLDEPTNDLDIPSLEVLEQALLEFPGAIVLVTHDRFMLERISTEFLALDGHGGARHHASFEQCQRAVAQHFEAQAAEKKAAAKQLKRDKKAVAQSTNDVATTTATPTSALPKKAKLSYKLQRELDNMESTILEAEEEVERLEVQAADPAVIADHQQATKAYQALGNAQTNVRTLYDRWAELEGM